VRIFGLIILTLLLTVFVSCHLDTTVRRPPTSITVDPAYVCPNETVTVSWDAGEQDPACVGLRGGPPPPPSERCIYIELSSTPTPVPWEPALHYQTPSSRGGIAIATTNTFSIHAQVSNYLGRYGPFDQRANATATVIDTGPTVQMFSFDGRCAGSRATWLPVNLRTLMSRCIEVQQICNASRDTMRLDDADAPGSRTVTLVPGQCTNVFNGPGTNLSVQNISFSPTPDLCGATTTSGEPPDLQISIHLACNRSLPGCAS
jgi:hypothetical protein